MSRRPQFPRAKFAAVLQRCGSLHAVARAAGYQSPGVVTTLSRCIRGLQQLGPRMLGRILRAVGEPLEAWHPWLEWKKTKTLICSRCGKTYTRDNLRPEENAKLRRRPGGKWEGLRCADCARKAAGVNPKSAEARAESLEAVAIEAVEGHWHLEEAEAYALVHSPAAGDRAKVRAALAARLRGFRVRYSAEELERRRRAAMADPTTHMQRAFRVWLGVILKRDPIRGLQLCRHCKLLKRSRRTGKIRRNLYHAQCWQTVMTRWRRRKTYPPATPARGAKRPGPSPERNLDRNLWLLIAAGATRIGELSLPYRELLVRAPKMFPGARRLGTVAAVTRAIEAISALLPGDATLFLAPPGALHFVRAVCDSAAQGVSLGALLAERIRRGDRDELIKRLHREEMSVGDIARLVGDADRVCAVLGAVVSPPHASHASAVGSVSV